MTVNNNVDVILNVKGKYLAVAMILILALSSAAVILPAVFAQPTAGSSVAGTVAPSNATNSPFSTAALTTGSNGLYNAPTYPGLCIAPNPCGVGQTIQIIMLIQLLPASVGVEAKEGVYGGWNGYTLTITDPNGTTTTMGPYQSDVTGSYQVSYTPTETGTYHFQFSFAGQTDASIYWGGISGDPLSYNANFLPSKSGNIALTVTNTPAPGYTEAPVPLPNAYWSIPVDAQNRFWNSICGPWLQSGYNATGAFNPYSYAPQSAHVLWTYQPYALPTEGGLVGGTYGSVEFGGQNTAVGGWTIACIMGGYVYFNGPTQQTPTSTVVTGVAGSANAAVASSYFYCMNIKTGQILWSAPGSITCGQVLDWRSQQSKLDTPYLWSISGNAYRLYSASTGALLDWWTAYTTPTGTAGALQISSIIYEQPPNPTVIGEDIGGAGGGGALLVYLTGMQEIYNANNGTYSDPATMWLACWNATQAINAYTGTAVWTGLPIPSSNPVVWSLPPVTATLNWNLGLMWNVTFPYFDSDVGEGGVGTYIPTTDRSHGPVFIGTDGNYVLVKNNELFNNATGQNTVTVMCFNALTGALVWNNAIDWPAYTTGSADGTGIGFGITSGGYLFGEEIASETIVCYNEATGALLWTDQPFQNDFAMQSRPAAGVAAYGNLYYAGYDGYMHCIDISTGTQLWDAISRPGGTEMPQPAYPMSGCTIADNTVFTSTSKGYEAVPLYRGHCLYAIDATTGQQVWNMSGEFSGLLVDDGVLVGMNNYDGIEYAFGAGPTCTTVTAPLTQVTAGNNVIIQGTVTDQTPGVLKGTPAISDSWMGAWMAYMFMDQPLPTQATGVPVTLTAIDPNGNYIVIGNATSDINGIYHFTWTPPNIPGTYTISATFTGSNSYYCSGSDTSVNVVSPGAPTAAPTATPTSVADLYFVPAIAGLFVLIIVVAIVLALLMLRKRP